jgi:hypothetical protein
MTSESIIWKRDWVVEELPFINVNKSPPIYLADGGLVGGSLCFCFIGLRIKESGIRQILIT